MNNKSDISALRIDRTNSTDNTIMPPQRKWLTRLLLPLVILTAAMLLLGYAARDSLVPAIDINTIRVVSKPLGQTAGSVTVQAPGWVEADPFPIYVPALAAGVVKEVLVLEGETVTKGQIVARMIDDDARLALEIAQANVKDHQARLRAAQMNWDHPIELDRMVETREALLKQVSAEIIQAASEINMQKAKLEELKDNHERIVLLPTNAVADLEIVQAKLKHKAQLSLLEATEKKLDVLSARKLAVEADLKAARHKRKLRIEEQENLDLSKAKLRAAEIALAQAQLRFDRMAVRSPAAGVVMKRLAVPGSKLMLEMEDKNSANVIHLYDPKKLQVRVDVPLADTANVGIDQKAEITVDVLPETVFTGKVTRIVHQADIQKNTLEVKVAIDNPSSQLKPEMLARVKFISNSQANSKSSGQRVLVPERFLQQRSGDTAVVWVVTTDQKATQRNITLGSHREEGWIDTLDGLQPGDTIITDSRRPLKEGNNIRIIGEVKP